MKKERIYVASFYGNSHYNEPSRGYICHAFNKSQMKAAGMNMKLGWIEEENYERAVSQLDWVDEIKETNVLNFRY